jgi:hypothetical protein
MDLQLAESILQDLDDLDSIAQDMVKLVES